MLCAKGGHVECAEILLGHGADVNAPGKKEKKWGLNLES